MFNGDADITVAQADVSQGSVKNSNILRVCKGAIVECKSCIILRVSLLERWWEISTEINAKVLFTSYLNKSLLGQIL